MIDFEDTEELEEVNEDDQIHLNEVTSFIETASKRIDNLSTKDSSLASLCSFKTINAQNGTSLPRSIDELEKEEKYLKTLPPGYESALCINQTLQRRFENTLKNLLEALKDNLEKQAQLDELEEKLMQNNKEDDKYIAKVSSFAVPYFKNRNRTPAPLNEDTKFKIDCGYLDLYMTSQRPWRTCEFDSLVKEVEREWKESLLTKWTLSLTAAQKKYKECSVQEEEKRKELMREVTECKNFVEFFSSIPQDKLLVPINPNLDWNKISAQAFDGYRTPEECRLQWENYLEPRINKSSWKESEDLEIYNAVAKCKRAKPNWDEIAVTLGTRRTPFQVMKRWVSFIKPTFHPKRWTSNDSKRLQDTVNMLRVGSHVPWTQVGCHLPGYTISQLKSRWKATNPYSVKGPFTYEEDLIMIKGLYKFGLNLEVIAHFLPGRNKDQVQDRFKRGLLPGMTSKPWTWSEDKKIIENCSQKSRRWRYMSLLLPRRITCQIRLRFYVLLFWQSISKRKGKLPPPLFPLALTRNPKEIKELRAKIMKFDPKVRINLTAEQEAEADVILLNSLQPSEKRREVISDQKKSEIMEKLLTVEEDDGIKAAPNAVRSRRGNPRSPYSLSWPDKALIEFFLPGRVNQGSQLRIEDERVIDNFHHICQALQLKIDRPVIAEDVEKLEKYEELTSDDAELVNNVSVIHHEVQNYDTYCLSCDTQIPEIIPLVPPNRVTVGAFRSLLLHKPKLEEMASKEFLFYEVPRSQLHKLGVKPKTLIDKERQLKLQVSEDELKEMCNVPDQREVGTSNTEEVQGVSEEGNRREAEAPRKTAAIAKILNYVHSREEARPQLLKEPLVQKEFFKPPSRLERVQLQLEGENRFCRRRRRVAVSKEQVIEEEDNLLFHRMLSLFLWPAFFTLVKPSVEKLTFARELSDEKTLEMNALKLLPAPKKPTIHEKFGEMSIEKMEFLVKKLECVQQRKVSNLGRNFIKKPEVPLQQKDMNQRIRKRTFVKLKKSLAMKKVWERRKLGRTKLSQEGREDVVRTRDGADGS